MEVSIVEAPKNPERVICRAARNDYSKDGTIGRSFREIMSPIGCETAGGDDIDETSFSDDDKMLRAKKRKLIRRLLQHGHFGPFEHPQATFAVEGVSRSLMAQLTRHRHVTFDVQSMRYVDFEDVQAKAGEGVVAIPELEDPGICGRNAEFEDWISNAYDDDQVIKERKDRYNEAIEKCFEEYAKLLELGVAPENARNILPIGTKVNIVFSLNVRMLMHVADMRASGEAQWEIREMTNEVLRLAEDWCPITFKYYDEELKNRKNRLAP